MQTFKAAVVKAAMNKALTGPIPMTWHQCAACRSSLCKVTDIMLAVTMPASAPHHILMWKCLWALQPHPADTVFNVDA